MFNNKEVKEKSIQINDKIEALKSSKLESNINKAGSIPTIIFGGMGAKCEQPDYVFLVQKFRNELHANTECYATNLLGSMRIQAAKACEFLQKNEKYNSQPEINVMGLSQGGLVARYIVEECQISEKTKVRNLLTAGTPNMGVTEIPQGGCLKEKTDVSNVMCRI